MKTIKIALLLILLTGCSALNTFGDYVNDNPLLADITTRQVVGRYIAAGDTVETEGKRATKVISTLTEALTYINGNPLASVSGLLLVVNNSINWDSLNPNDKILIMDIMAVLKQELSKHQEENNLSKDSQLAIRDLFETAISTAKIYEARQ